MSLSQDQKLQILPRIDLREPAFRRYEPIIAEACKQTIEYNPLLKLNVNPHTFACRFRDAILGKRRYHYHSSIIPRDFDITVLRVHELSNGNVLIENPVADTGAITLRAVYSSDNPESIIRLMQQISKGEIVDLPVIVPYRGETERDLILKIASDHNLTYNPDTDGSYCHVRDFNGKLNFYTV